MRLNELKPAPGSRPEGRRVGRGIGSGLGKTAGRGHKGQKSRAGGFHKVGFEGGQMPLQRRLPKRGFIATTKPYVATVRLDALNQVNGEFVDIEALKQARLIKGFVTVVKLVASGNISAAYKVRGLRMSSKARAAIESAGGSVEP